MILTVPMKMANLVKKDGDKKGGRHRRYDLDCIRGVAVISVLLFHLNSDWFPNGHLGVDLFLVLSGHFIFDSHCSKRRPFAEFLHRRVWRIFPAYYAFLFVTTLVAGYLLVEKDWRTYLAELQKASVFATNIQLDDSASRDYFAAVTEFNFLLHTWSLALELQFYLVSIPLGCLINACGELVPIILTFTSIALHIIVPADFAFYALPCRLWQFLAGYFAVLADQLGTRNADRKECDLVASKDDISENGLLPDLQSGSMSLPKQQPGDIGQQFLSRGLARLTSYLTIAVLCLGPIRFAHLFIQRICITVCCTALIIMGDTDEASAFARLFNTMNNAVLKFFGDVSYSLYLYHWPAALFLNYLLMERTQMMGLTIYFGCSVAFSVLSTYLLERPLQKCEHSSLATVFIAFFVPVMFCLLSTHPLSLSSDGANFVEEAVTSAPQYINQFVLGNEDIDRFINISSANLPTNGVNKFTEQYRLTCGNCKKTKKCNFCEIGSDKADKYVAIFGDSHALVVFMSMKYTKAIRSKKFIYLGAGGCRPYTECKTVKAGFCPDVNEQIKAKLAHLRVEAVVVACRCSFDINYHLIEAGRKTPQDAINIATDCYASALRYFSSFGVPIYIVYPFPEAGFSLPGALLKALRFNWEMDRIMISTDQHNRTMFHTLAMLNTVTKDRRICANCTVIDPAKAFCDEKFCKTFIGKRAFYRDSNHLSELGMQQFAKILPF